MADNTNKVTIGAEPITIPAAQFARILAAAVHCEYLMKQSTSTRRSFIGCATS